MGKTRKLIIIVSLVLVFAAVSALAYNQFFRSRDVSELVSDDATFFLSLDLTNASGSDGEALLKTMGGSESLQDLVGKIAFGETFSVKNLKTDFSWAGGQIALAKQKLSKTEDRFTVLIKIRDQKQAEEFLQNAFSEITSEKFKSQTITTAQKPTPIAYAIVRDFVVLSEDSFGIKKVIDQSSSFKNSISGSDLFKEAKKEQDKDSVALLLSDSQNLVSISSLLLPLDLLQLVSAQSDLSTNLRFAVILSQTNDGLKLTSFFPSSGEKSTERLKKDDITKSVLLDYAPANSVFYLVSSDINKTILNLVGGSNQEESAQIDVLQKTFFAGSDISIETDFFDNFVGPFAVMAQAKVQAATPMPTGYLLTGLGSQYDITLLAETDDEQKIKTVLVNLFNSLVATANASTGLAEKLTLQTEELNYHDRQYTHYQWGSLQLYLVLFDDALALGTTESGAKNAIDTKSGAIDSLAKNDEFKEQADNAWSMARDVDSASFWYLDLPGAENNSLESITGLGGSKKDKTYFKALFNAQSE